MKYIFFMMALTSCGEEIIDQPEEPIQISPKCLNCDYTTVDDYISPEPKDSVQIIPNELGFYSIYNGSDILKPKTIKIINNTDVAIIIFDIFITDDLDSFIGGDGGAQYFNLIEDYSGKIIQPKNNLPIEIEFIGSLYERAAILYIYTSFENTLLSASLYGKIFIW